MWEGGGERGTRGAGRHAYRVCKPICRCEHVQAHICTVKRLVFKSLVQNSALHVHTKARSKLYIRLVHVWCMNSETRGAPTAEHCRCWCRRTTMHTHEHSSTKERGPFVGGWDSVHAKRHRYRLVTYVFHTFSVFPKRTIRVGGPPSIFSAARRPRFEGRNTNMETNISRPTQHLNGQRSLVTYALLITYLLLTY